MSEGGQSEEMIFYSAVYLEGDGMKESTKVTLGVLSFFESKAKLSNSNSRFVGYFCEGAVYLREINHCTVGANSVHRYV
jgi:hypothetical protein